MARANTTSNHTTAGDRAAWYHLESGTALAELDLDARRLRAKLLRDGASALAHGLRSGLSSARSAVKRLTARRRTLKALNRLDSRTLQDIGINPRDIAGSVDNLMEERQRGSFVASMDHLADPVRRWDMSRRAAGELARLPNETLRDFGYGRGDLNSVAASLAQRERATRAANKNQPAHRHAA